MTSSRQFFISGRVQGVYFRAATQSCARKLGLTGWVRNLPDGRVQALAQGSFTALQEFEKWLWQGPEDAEVEKVAGEEVDDPTEYQDFAIDRSRD
jgi:acylphosphatase